MSLPKYVEIPLEELRELKGEVVGSSDDGDEATVWAISSSKRNGLNLRGAIDALIKASTS